MDKKLYRSPTDKKIAGVCGGVAEYFNIDPTIVRLVFVLLGLTWFTGVIVYIVAAFIIPEKSSVQESKNLDSTTDTKIVKEESNSENQVDTKVNEDKE